MSSRMITCPHCHRHVRPTANQSDFPCPMCGEGIDPSTSEPKPNRLWISLGVGVVVAVATGVAVYYATEPDEETFEHEMVTQPVYGFAYAPMLPHAPVTPMPEPLKQFARKRARRNLGRTGRRSRTSHRN